MYRNENNAEEINDRESAINEINISGEGAASAAARNWQISGSGVSITSAEIKSKA